jgi:hypothetical protein
MKKVSKYFSCTAIILLTILAINLIALTRNQISFPNDSDFSKLKLEISSTKKEFLQLEPIPIVLTLSNKTPQRIVGHSAINISQNYVKLFVSQNGGAMQEIETLTLNRKLVVAMPKEIGPGEHYQSKQLLTLNLDGIFPHPGTYQIQAVLMDTDGKKKIKSDQLNIRIVEPQGLDNQAFEYIKSQGESSNFFYGVDLPGSKNTPELMEAFSSQFAESVYGDYAAFILGEFYFYKEEFEKASKKFDKVAKKQDFVFADKAKDYLAKAREKLGKTGKLN